MYTCNIHVSWYHSLYLWSLNLKVLFFHVLIVTINATDMRSFSVIGQMQGYVFPMQWRKTSKVTGESGIILLYNYI